VNAKKPTNAPKEEIPETPKAVEPQIVISAAPQLRDLQKELLHMKPAALRRKNPAIKPVDPFESGSKE
jgi:hypothetical protein